MTAPIECYLSIPFYISSILYNGRPIRSNENNWRLLPISFCEYPIWVLAVVESKRHCNGKNIAIESLCILFPTILITYLFILVWE